VLTVYVKETAVSDFRCLSSASALHLGLLDTLSASGHKAAALSGQGNELNALRNVQQKLIRGYFVIMAVRFLGSGSRVFLKPCCSVMLLRGT
jgi:hypothetical protein